MCFKRLSLFLLTSLAAIVFVGWTFPSDAFKHIFMLSIKLSITLAATVFCHLSIDFDKIENWVPGESDLLSNSIYHSPTLHRKIRFSTRSAFGWSPRKTASAIFYVSNSNFSVQLLETRSSILHIIPLRTAKIALPESTVDDDDLGKAFEHNNGSVIVLTTPQTVYRIHTAHKHQLEALIKLCELSMQTRHLHSIASQQAFSTVDPL
ncbi:hypothetical protein BC829DRAFT_280604 [Chytridium lagenaria]|nr:hypothetical protein BC829DRAFT_280604 [Chytridium lagenaria]